MGRARGIDVACPVCVEHRDEAFHVAGMDCGDEVTLLERRFARLPGFESMAADLVGQRVRVRFDATRLSSSDIVRAVAETGLRAWPDGDPARPVRPPAHARLAPLVTSGALVACGFLLRWAGAGPLIVVPVFAAGAIAGALLTARRAWTSVRHLTLDMNALMLVAVVGAIGLGDWAEGATVIFLFALAQWLESRSMARARHAIRALMDLAPDEATVRRGGADVLARIDDVQVGESIVVRPGERIPLDGKVAAGLSLVNQAPITGESLPVDKAPGSEVFAGSINGDGVLEIDVTHLRRDTTLAHIISLVEHAQEQRAPAQAFVDRFARIYTPAVMALAAIVAIAPTALFGEPLGPWFYRALVLLVISCPCALVISTPVSIVSALAGAARRGVLIKGGLFLERAAQIQAIAFDKTGTLTRGRPEVVSVRAFNGTSPDDVVRVAAALESRSLHPIAGAIVRYREVQGLPAEPADAVTALPGLGAEGRVGGLPALVGSHRLFAERGLIERSVEAEVTSAGHGGQTGVLVAWAGRIVGLVCIADRPRPGARDVVTSLARLGVGHLAMLTGDNEAAARAVAAEVGIDDCRAELLPSDKVDAVVEVRRRHGAVMMVGDGVNDAPALAAADLSVAMGAAGADAALDTADIALMADDLSRIPYLVRLGRRTLAVVRANIALSLGLKAVFLALAVAGQATLWMAVLADMGASLLVIANGLRLLRSE